MAISVSDTTPRVDYTVGSTAQQTFSVPFATEQATDIKVFVDDVEATYVSSLVGQTGTKFTLNNVGTSNSTEVQFATAQSNVTIDIIRDTAISRTSDFNTGGFFDIEDLNVELSRVTRNLQDLELRVDQAISAPLQEGGPGDLPTATSRAGKLLAFDSSGNVTTKTSAITEYLGAFVNDLTNRPDGTALQVGDLYYNTTALETRIWTGTAWDLVFGRVQPISTTYTSTGLTQLTLSARPSSVLSILVIIDGVLQNVANYTLSDNVITFTTAPPIGSSIEIRDFSSTVSSGSGTIIDLSGTEVTQANIDLDKLLTDIASATNRIDTSQLSTSLQNQISNVSTVDGRVLILENVITQNGVNVITDQGTKITALETLTSGLDTTVNGSAPTSLASRVSALEVLQVQGSGSITLDLNRITNLESQVFEADGTTRRLATVNEHNSLNATVSTLNGSSTAHATRLTNLESIVTGGTGTSVLATISSLNSVTATAASADTKATSAAAQVNTLQSTVGNNTTSITQTTQSVDGIQGKYSVKISSNGYISGFGLISTANEVGGSTTQFVVNADRFVIADSLNVGTAKHPFQVVNGVTNIRDAVIDSLQANKLRGDVNKQEFAETTSSSTLTSSYVLKVTCDLPAPDNTGSTSEGHAAMAMASLYFSSTSDGIYGKLTACTLTGSTEGTEYVLHDVYEDWYVSTLNLNARIPTQISASGKTTSGIRFKLYAKHDGTACNLTKANILAMGLR
ncbi:Phage-related protein [uncultured Mediterranean phage uvMED]|nr:Phage-related protein [uncultured Mediterranean phage uvMED]BAR16540.1 Phage-related protein [uncultured Mediterranean phage uvMED]